MKRFNLVILMFMMLLAAGLTLAVGLTFAATQFAWDAPTTNADGSPLTDLAGYKVYTCAKNVGQTNCNLATGTKIADVTAPATTSPIPQGQGYAFVTAVDTTGNESAPSNVIFFDLVGPNSPTNMRTQ